MEKKLEPVSQPYVFNLPNDLLNTLIYHQDATDQRGDESKEQGDIHESEVAQYENQTGPQLCSICDVRFSTVEAQRSHVKSDLHCYNLKRKINGREIVTEDQLEQLIGDLSESISGSESSEDEDDEEASKESRLSNLLKKQALITSDHDEIDNWDQRKQTRAPRKSALMYFTSSTLPSNIYLAIYRAIFTNLEQENDSMVVERLKEKQILQNPNLKTSTEQTTLRPPPEQPKEPHFFLCMIGGGHFAGMIVSLIPKQNSSFSTRPLAKDIKILAHKTFHRYTTRRKQGGAQSTNDSAKGAAHSAGASLRRYNEQALTEEVRFTLQDWKSMIDSSELLFIRATGPTSRRTLFGPYDQQVLLQKDPRIRGFPFNTRRATQSELVRSFFELTRVKFLDVTKCTSTTQKAVIPPNKIQDSVIKLDKKSPIKITEEEQTALLHTSQIQGLIRRKRLPALIAYFKSNCLSPDFLFQPLNGSQNHMTSTPLHFAAHLNSAPIVSALLLKCGADPGVRNNDGKFAYELAGDRATRQAFRVARFELGEEKWNWEQIGIPRGISRCEAEAENQAVIFEETKKEQIRRKEEVEKLEKLNPELLNENRPQGKLAKKGRMVALGQVAKTPQEKREDEARGLTPEMRLRLDRERRARAAEERMKKMANGT
ncbi:VMS1-like protein [Golovinomyces cichoracearum]|uniref:VMS1-like protein n=1 Tax=Golovinomyces cichoracearum TaxID=62708 RepID=A0A420HQY9_9PEZI|nr:VMS1-like protein [Golovinomyces cichoracearum]